MNGAFTGQILAEKLAKLNSSRQSIETLSHWCIFHRKKARQVVQTWEKEFHSGTRDQRVPFLYLANDILQNSRRKGGEFVTEFWKVLPAALRDVVDNGDDSARTSVYRLVDIWEERRVFGSRVRTLREELLGKGPLSPVRDNMEKEKVQQSAELSPKIQKITSEILEKISAAFKTVQDGQVEEEEALENCKVAIRQVETLEKEAESHTNSGHLQDSMADELQEQQSVLAHCIEQLESSEMTRGTLVQCLKDALTEQESKLDQLRTHLQIAQAQAEQAGSVRQRLLTGSPSLSDLSPISRENGLSSSNVGHHSDVPSISDKDNPMSRVSVGGAVPPSSGSLGLERIAPREDDSKNQKAPHSTSTAAEVAAKLAASTSSAAMLTSVLSSLAAEEATSLNSGVRMNSSLPLDVPALVRPLDKRQRLDGSDAMSSYSMASQLSPVQSGLQPPMPQPPPMGQYMGGQMMQYGFGVALPPPPPPPPPMQGHPMMAMQQRIAGHPQPLPPGMGAPGPYQLQPPKMGYYSSPPMPAPPAPMRPQ